MMWFAQIYFGIILKTSQRANMISPGFFEIIRNYFTRRQIVRKLRITFLCANLQYRDFTQFYDLFHTNLNSGFVSHNCFRANLNFQFRAIYFTFGLFTLPLISRNFMISSREFGI